MTEIQLTSEITVRPIQSMGGDHMVVAAAKVSVSGLEAASYASPAVKGENEGLINYLMKMRHGTPFEHSTVTFFVHAPMFVWWEWVRHRIGFSYNIESSRYKTLDPVFWIPRPTRKMVPSDKHKSARPDFTEASAEIHATTVARLRLAYERSYRAYEYAMSDGIASEVARAVLPSGVYFSGWVTCNPRSLMAFLSLRTHDPAATFPSYPQAEIEEAARAAEETLKTGWPITYAAFNKHGRVAP